MGFILQNFQGRQNWLKILGENIRNVMFLQCHSMAIMHLTLPELTWAHSGPC